MGNLVITRVQRTARRPSRSLEERVFVRFPSLYRHQARLFSRLSPRSRLRRASLRRALVSGWSAVNRGDLELRRVMFAPDVETELARDDQALGLSGLRGQAATDEALSELAEVWEWELEPAYILDLGDRVLLLGVNRMRARSSGVQLEQEYAQLVTAPDGLVTRDESWPHWDEGLRAAGLDPDAIALPKRRERHAAGDSSL